MVAQRGIPARRPSPSATPRSTCCLTRYCWAVVQLVDWIGLKVLPIGLLFATRPYNLPELFILNKSAYDPAQRGPMQTVVLAMRGSS